MSQVTPPTISSLQNPNVKHVVKLRSRQHRDGYRQTVVEGARETTLALADGVIPIQAYFCPPLLDESSKQMLGELRHLALKKQTRLFEVTTAVFAKIAVRENGGGLLFVIPYLQFALSSLADATFLVVIEGGEKPGNLGAILRTADAAGADGVIISQGEHGGTDIHNPNVIRASLGAIFTRPVVTAATPDAIAWLQRQGIQIIATTPDSNTLYTAVNLTQPVAIVMGSEAHGLSQEWLAAADEKVKLPMHGRVDSLNLSAATAVLLYETLRQREIC